MDIDDLDERGYPTTRGHSSLIHRQIAYRQIYQKNRHKYPKKFSNYVVHHINSDREDFSVSNLYICTKEEHEAIHEEQKNNVKKFKTKKQLDEFLEKWRDRHQTKLSDRKFMHIYEHDKEPGEEEKTNKAHKKVSKRYWWIFIIAALIILAFAIRYNYVKNQGIRFEENPIQENVPNSVTQEIEPIVVSGGKTDITITNNKDEEITLNITYDVNSNWYGGLPVTTRIFSVGPNTTEKFEVYKNDGCATVYCAVEIIDYKEI